MAKGMDKELDMEQEVVLIRQELHLTVEHTEVKVQLCMIKLE